MRKSLLVLVVLMLATAATADVEILNTGWGDLSITSCVQFRFTEVFPDDRDDDTDDIATGDFDFRRVFFDLKGSITEYWDFLVRVDVLNANDLPKFYATFKPVDMFSLHFGRLQTPFSFETQVSGTALEFVETSLMSDINPGAKDGLMAELTLPGNQAGTFYLNLKLGLFDNDRGTGFGYQGGLNEESIIDYAASVASMPIPGLIFGGYFYMGNDYQYDDGTDQDFFDTMAYGGGAFYNPSFGEIDLKVGGEYAMGTHGFADMENAAFDGMEDVSWMGYYGMLMVGFEIGSDFLDRIEIGGAYEGLDLDADTDNDGQAALTIGTNLYFSEAHHAKLQLDYQMGMPEHEDTPKHDVFIAQLQLMF